MTCTAVDICNVQYAPWAVSVAWERGPIRAGALLSARDESFLSKPWVFQSSFCMSMGVREVLSFSLKPLSCTVSPVSLAAQTCKSAMVRTSLCVSTYSVFVVIFGLCAVVSTLTCNVVLSSDSPRGISVFSGFNFLFDGCGSELIHVCMPSLSKVSGTSVFNDSELGYFGGLNLGW